MVPLILLKWLQKDQNSFNSNALHFTWGPMSVASHCSICQKEHATHLCFLPTLRGDKYHVPPHEAIYRISCLSSNLFVNLFSELCHFHLLRSRGMRDLVVLIPKIYNLSVEYFLYSSQLSHSTMTSIDCLPPPFLLSLFIHS
jgi:hypothetical protein